MHVYTIRVAIDARTVSIRCATYDQTGPCLANRKPIMDALSVEFKLMPFWLPVTVGGWIR